MDSLRVLLIHDGSKESDSVSSVLREANLTVLPAKGVDEAADALGHEHFDAVLLGPALASDSLSRFATRVRALNNPLDNRLAGGHMPILSLSFAPPVSELEIDAAIPPPFGASEFVAVVNDLARTVPTGAVPDKPEAAALPILEVEELRAQVGYDDDLMVEIIDIFLESWRSDLADMGESLAAKDLKKHSRQAHTIKGSLSSLHAQAARAHAQTLETAAGQGDETTCRQVLPLFESALRTLAPALEALRANPKAG